MSTEMHDSATEVEQTGVAPDPNGSPAEPKPNTDTEPEGTAPSEPQSKREARYRTQLRATEAERDGLAARIEAMQRTEVERIAGNVIQKPDALWATDTALADLLDDTGAVDPDKVKAAAHAAKEALGLELGEQERKKRGPVVPREGTGINRSERNAWKEAFTK